jgi:uncharacterized protein YjgD (DUF1641 family)
MAMTEARMTNEPMDEIARLSTAAREALTDSMVERLATTGANALEVLDRLNDEGTGAAIHALIDRLTELHKLGAMDTLFDFVTLLHAARNASTDNIVERLFTSFEQMINTVGNEDMGRLAQNTRDAIDDAAAEAERMPTRSGLLATLSLLSKPEAQRSLMFLLSFGARLQQRAAGH